MAEHAAVSCIHPTTTADEVDEVSLTGSHANVEIVNRSDDDLWYTIGRNPTDPTVGGEDVYYLPPRAIAQLPNGGHSGTTIKVLSAGASAYSLQAVPA